MLHNQVLPKLEEKMDGAIMGLKKELSGLRTGRASPSFLDSVTVDAYGDFFPLNQVSTISVAKARLLTVQVWDNHMVRAVEKAIRESPLGLNPSVEGQVIRIPLPDLSEERRREITKAAGQSTEKFRVSVRNIRRDSIEAVRKFEKDGTLSEDERHRSITQIQKITDEKIATIDQLFQQKEQEIMKV